MLQSDTYRDFKKKYAAGANEALAIIRGKLEWRARVGLIVSSVLGLVGIAVIGFSTAIWKRVIDSQLHARSLLERTEAHLFKALDLAEAVVWEANLKDGTFSSPSNMSAFLGPNPPGPQGKADFWSRFLHPSDIERVRGLWTDALKAGAPVDMELKVTLPDGRSCWDSRGREARNRRGRRAGARGRPGAEHR